MTTCAGQDRRLAGRALFMLAVAAGSAIASSYAMQPALPEIAADFGVEVASLTTVIFGAIAGYLIGLVLLVPLVDRLSPRVLIPGQFLALALSLALAARAASPDALIGCFVLIGATTTVAAQSSAIVGKLADASRRALSMAAISAGISAGMLWFFAFNLIWVGLIVRLAAPPYHLNAGSIGLYSLAGLTGLAMTRIAGGLADRFGNCRVMVCGLLCASLAASTLGVVLDHVPATLMALAIFDAGCFAAQVANQAGVVAIDPLRSGVLNSAYLFFYYGAGAAGTAIAGSLALRGGWQATVLLAAFAVAAAAVVSACLRAFPRAG